MSVFQAHNLVVEEGLIFEEINAASQGRVIAIASRGSQLSARVLFCLGR